MDTIAVNLIFKKEFSRMEVVCEIKDYIRNITSPYGYRYCDILPNNSKNQILVKISYPRYFYGNNAYLIKTSDEYFEVQEDFAKALVLTIEKTKTRENAITTIKKFLSEYENERRKIVLKVLKRIKEIRKVINRH